MHVLYLDIHFVSYIPNRHRVSKCVSFVPPSISFPDMNLVSCCVSYGPLRISCSVLSVHLNVYSGSLMCILYSNLHTSSCVSIYILDPKSAFCVLICILCFDMSPWFWCASYIPMYIPGLWYASYIPICMLCLNMYIVPRSVFWCAFYVMAGISVPSVPSMS